MVTCPYSFSKGKKNRECRQRKKGDKKEENVKEKKR